MKALWCALGFAVFFIVSCSPEKEKKSDQKDPEVAGEVDPILTNPDYGLWRVGKFYYRERPTGTFLVNRTDSIQEEFIKSSGMIVEFNINWLSDSSYILAFSRISENPYDGEIADGIYSLVKKCVITRVTDWHYVEEATSNLSKDTIRTRIYRYR